MFEPLPGAVFKERTSFMCVPNQPGAAGPGGGAQPGMAVNPDIMNQAEQIDPQQAAKALQEVTKPKKLKK